MALPPRNECYLNAWAPPHVSLELYLKLYLISSLPCSLIGSSILKIFSGFPEKWWNGWLSRKAGNLGGYWHTWRSSLTDTSSLLTSSTVSCLRGPIPGLFSRRDFLILESAWKPGLWVGERASVWPPGEGVWSLELLTSLKLKNRNSQMWKSYSWHLPSLPTKVLKERLFANIVSGLRGCKFRRPLHCWQNVLKWTGLLWRRVLWVFFQ